MSWLNTPNSIAIDGSDLDTDYYTDAPLPSPANTPYRTPQLSRKSSYQHESSFPANSPPLGRSASPIYQHPHHPHNRVSLLAHDPTKDETISLLDPRRFTPTLHANLVAEILSLRRELESKAQFIDHLENDLSAARNEQETATSSIASAQREAREVKRRLAIAENDTAVENIIQERDDAVEAIGELKRQVERLTKRGRIAEEEVERTRKMAERDAEKWSELKRELERRTHIAEGRLRMVLEEVAAADQKPDEERPASASDAEGTDTGSIHRSVSDAASIRTISRTGYRPQSFMAGDDVAERFGVRFSHLGFGQSLADELDLPEEDESDEYEEEAVDASAGAEAEASEEEGDSDGDYISDLEETEGMLTPMQLERVPIVTAEVSVQTEEEYPEPQSPIQVVDPQQELALAEKVAELAQANDRIMELEGKLFIRDQETSELERKANELAELLTAKETAISEALGMLVSNEKTIQEQSTQLEELIHTEKPEPEIIVESSPMVQTGTQTTIEHEVQKIMVECGIQVMEEAPELPTPETPAEVSPPKTYATSSTQTAPMAIPKPEPVPQLITIRPQMASAGVQTDHLPGGSSLNRNTVPPSLPLVIPTIQIIPPPPTPPLMPVPKIMIDAFSQTIAPSTRTTAMQTDMIFVEAPPPVAKPLPTLLPSALLASPTPLPLPDVGPAPSLPRRSSKRVTRKDSSPAPPQITLMGDALMEDPLEDEEEDDDAGGCTPPPIGKGKGKYRESFSSLRPIRTSSLFPAPSIDFPGSSDDESINYSDNEYKTVLSAPKPVVRKQRLSKPTALPEPASSSKLTPGLRRNPSMLRGSSSQAGPARGRTPTSTNGSAASSGAIGPPFPVPARFSSRKVTPTGGEKPESSAPFSGTSRGLSRNPRNPSLRKSRSAITLTSTREAQSPPPLSASTAPPDSPILLPPLPRDEVRSPAFPTTSYRTPLSQYQNKYQKEPVSSQASTTTSYAGHGHAKVESVVQQTSVVDAIAQTMVGEWMWKYVRRRKSFGVPDSPPGWDGKDEGGGQRHKRWVWLAPYERAVMWSSRQPTSGSALLGKSGRKLPIQSVLDVKDDTPLPRGTSPTPVFNRSILILTPARALKFTACSKERHYVWLTALSFLSHSAQEADGLLSLPPPMPFEYEQMEQQQAQPTPTRIFTEHDSYPAPPPLKARDSIRLAKSKKPDNNSQSSGLNIRKSGKVKEHVREDSYAMPPSIPRYPGQHVRRRSNTGSRPPNSRSFTAPFNSNSSYNGSMTTNESMYYGNGVVGGIGIISGNTSIANGSGVGTGIVGGWDAPVGTVRMAAFVDSPKSKSEFDGDSLYSNSSNAYQIRRDRQRRDQWGPPRTNNEFFPDEDDFFRNDDPFRGF